jgi:hypothetical protein
MAIDKHAAADKAIAEKFHLTRSPEWPNVEKQFKTAHPKCAACGDAGALNVHHRFPFHYVVLCGRPDLELDPRNLITLCTDKDDEHHILLGHLDDYESYNPDVLKFVTTYANQKNPQIRKDPAFKKAAAGKPKHLNEMSAAEKTAFKNMLDHNLPASAEVVAKAAKARAGTS